MITCWSYGTLLILLNSWVTVALAPCEVPLVLVASASTGKPGQKAKTLWYWHETSTVGWWLLEIVEGTCRDVKNMVKVSETAEAKRSQAAPKKCLLQSMSCTTQI